jgi:hypothetical protein
MNFLKLKSNVTEIKNLVDVVLWVGRQNNRNYPDNTPRENEQNFRKSQENNKELYVCHQHFRRKVEIRLKETYTHKKKQ